MAEWLRVGMTPDFQTAQGNLLAEAVQHTFACWRGIACEYLAQGGEVATPERLVRWDAIVVRRMKFTRDSLDGVERLAVLARWGVGYNMIDVDACTEHDVAVCITPEAIRRPVAEGVVTLMLALSKNLLLQDRLTRTGHWYQRDAYLGRCLKDRVLGCIGLGNIGTEVLRLLHPFDMARFLVYDPYVTPQQAQDLGAVLTDLDTLLRESDYVSISCPLTPETYHMVGERELGLMKPTAFLINTARGPVVDEAALVRALQARRIAGAGLDVFDREPVQPDNPLLQLENVVLSPHAIALTEESVRDLGVDACQNVLIILRGEVPKHVVNREVLSRPGFRAKLQRLREQFRAWNGSF